MKSFIFSIFLFVLGFIFINSAYYYLIRSTDINFKKRIESINFVNPKFDLLIFGNSLVLDGIDAQEITSESGLYSYNFALDGCNFKSSYIQLEEYLSKYSYKPKFVILGSGTYIADFDGENIQPIIEVTMTNYEYTMNDIPLVKFKWLGIEFAKKIISKNHRDAYLKLGQLRFDKTRSDTTIQNSIKEFQYNKYFKSKWLKKIIDLCLRNNINLFVLEMPGYKNTRNTNTQSEYILNKNAYCSAILYNFNSVEFCKIFDQDNDWIGNSHLNSRGAAKFSKELTKIIRLSNYQQPNESVNLCQHN